MRKSTEIKEQILNILKTRAMTINEVQKMFHLNRADVSNYMKSLKTFGLIDQDPETKRYTAERDAPTYEETYRQAKNGGASRAGNKPKEPKNPYATEYKLMDTKRTSPGIRPKISPWTGYTSF